MHWATVVLIGCIMLASACYLYGDESEQRARIANVTAVTLVGVGIVIFFAGIFGSV